MMGNDMVSALVDNKEKLTTVSKVIEEIQIILSPLRAIADNLLDEDYFGEKSVEASVDQGTLLLLIHHRLKELADLGDRLA